jgi:holo-ACP synthase
MIKPIDILNAREDRAFLQENLITKFKLPLLVIRVNYPGINKNNPTTKYISETIYQEILKNPIFNGDKVIKIKNVEKINSYEGLIFLLSINLSSIEIKKLAINIEINHPLGRLVDLDVIDLTNHTISRRELGYPQRKCFICDDLAHNCVRSRKHSLEEVLEYIENLVHQFLI